MARDIAIILDEILQSISWIQADTSGVDVRTFLSDRKLRQLVERNIEIISEASRRIPDDLKTEFPQMPWRQIADIGNMLRHSYHDIRPTIIWDVVTKDLPALRHTIEQMNRSLE